MECLITKLRASVTDDTLPYFGKGRLNVDITVERTVKFLIAGASTTTVKIVGNGTITPDQGSPSKEAVVYNTASNKLSVGKYTILFDKYNVLPTGITTNDIIIDLEDLAYSQVKPTELFFEKWAIGDIANLANFTSATKVYANNSKLNGDIKVFKNMPNLTILNISNNSQISGNIASLGSLIKLTTLGIGGNKIEGSIESFVIEQRAKGRTSCDSIAAPYMTGQNINNITFNGVKPTSNNDTKLSWTENTITYNGVTINA